ncbi:MAG: DUF1761 domain-containing protein [Melioribacteraceae bacterium]|nr:DUF1761 domain-containing protein [Melioribacteraceae bacterium]
MEDMYINHFAVIVAAISDFAVGALWYSPLLFYKAWKDENKLTDEILKKINPAKTYGMTFIFSLIISYNLAFFLGDANTDTMWGLSAGILAGLGWASLAFATVSLFEMKSWKYILINCGYITVAFALKGLIIGAWR